MPVKIIDLPSATTVTNADLLPATQVYSGNRDTYKLSMEQIVNFANIGPYEAIESLKNQSLANNASGLASLKQHVDTDFVHLSGDIMTGNLDLSGNKLNRFSANIIEVTANTVLDNSHNGSIILVTKTRVNADDRVELQIPAAGTLVTGFNILVIQNGTTQVKITNPVGGITIASADNSLSTRQQYSQINLCVLKSNLVWISGDLV